MSATNAFETALLSHIFNNAAIALIGDASGLQPAGTVGSLYVSLLTADPGEAATSQLTSEANYTGYSRVAVNRSAGGWTVSGNNVSNTAAVTFPQASGGTSTVVFFGIGTAISDTGSLLLVGTLSATLEVTNGITPQFAAGALDVNVD